MNKAQAKKIGFQQSGELNFKKLIKNEERKIPIIYNHSH